MFVDGDWPTKVVKTPSGFHLYFEYRKKTSKDLRRLAILYGGDLCSAKVTQQLYTIGTKIGDHTYREL
jgi:hypothetical protein